MHIAGPLRDPDDHKLLGYEAIYTATALVQRAGEPAKAVLIDPARETLAGDRLLASEDTQAMLNFTPHPPSTDTRGHILDVVGGTDLVGLYQVVVINRGRSQGVDPGTVLAIDHRGDVVPDVYRGGRNIGSDASRHVRAEGAAAERAQRHAAGLQVLRSRQLRPDRRRLRHHRDRGRRSQSLGPPPAGRAPDTPACSRRPPAP